MKLGFRPVRRLGFTLIEILVVISIIAILAAMLLSAISIVRERSRTVEAAQTVTQLTVAMDQYASEDEEKRFPGPFGPRSSASNVFAPAATTYYRYSEPADPVRAFAVSYADLNGGIAIDGVLGLFENRGIPLVFHRYDHSDDDRRLLDPWQKPYHYRLSLPAATRSAFTCTHSTANLALSNWNWDATATPAAREMRRNGRDPNQARPYPYIYSWGKRGTATDPCTWVYQANNK